MEKCEYAEKKEWTNWKLLYLFLPPELSRDDEAKERFIHEAQAASALDHSNICTIHEIGETEDGQLFICMAYYEGETLKKRVGNNQSSVDSITGVNPNY